MADITRLQRAHDEPSGWSGSQPATRRNRPGSRRGAALLVVITAIAVITATAADLAYNVRVSLQIAANGRDELRAYYLAKSAVNLSRLVIHFQHQLDQASGSLGQLLGSAVPGGAPGLGVRLWELVPVDSAAMAPILGGAPVAPPEGTAKSAAPAEPSFHARIEDEDRKIDVPQLAGIGTMPAAQLARIRELIQDPKYDFLFNREDASGTRTTRDDLVIAFKDWVDEDEVSSALSSNPAAPFEQAFSDENYVYDRYPERYKAKNARFDSLDELYLVAGVSDAFMAAFGDKLTVYPDVNAQANINTDDPQQLIVNTLVMSDPPGVPQLPVLDPAFVDKLRTALQVVRPLPFLSMTPQQFAAAIMSLGVRVQPLYQQARNTDVKSAFTDRSSTFHIHAVGTVGSVRKTIDAVVTTDQRAGALAADLGRLLHWRED